MGIGLHCSLCDFISKALSMWPYSPGNLRPADNSCLLYQYASNNLYDINLNDGFDLRHQICYWQARCSFRVLNRMNSWHLAS